jgi:nickel transport protein
VDGTVTGRLALAVGVAALLAAAPPAAAHGLNVFASTDCETVRVEAKFANGRRPVSGEVRLLDGANVLLATAELGEDGAVDLPLEGFDTSGGLLVEVETAGHDDYWILTPEDIARQCAS